jgi:hypothetical protein
MTQQKQKNQIRKVEKFFQYLTIKDPKLPPDLQLEKIVDPDQE